MLQTEERWVNHLMRKIPWRRKWLPTPVFLTGKARRYRRLAGYSPWGHKESNMTENLSIHAHIWGYPCGVYNLSWWAMAVSTNILYIRSVAQSCPTLCDPMNNSTPGLPVHHQLPEFTETHIHRVSDVIQPSHPLTSPFPPASNPSQHQNLFQRVNSSNEVAKVLQFQL